MQFPSERRRDPMLRQIVNTCNPLLAAHGFELTHRGQALSATFIGFRRPAEADVPPEKRTAVVLGHDPSRRVLLAHCHHNGAHNALAWRGPYADPGQLAQRSQEVVQVVRDWLPTQLH
jgi:hypothetical protein